MWSEEIRFFLEHREEIAAIIEINIHARREIVETTRMRVEKAIDQDVGISPWMGMRDLRAINEDEQVWWYSPRLFNFSNGVGLYFWPQKYERDHFD